MEVCSDRLGFGLCEQDLTLIFFYENPQIMNKYNMFSYISK